ncbi:maleylpyruvate isomerase family mycothiol-dependent enzyme [Nocardioides coralli]|uniref:maleylpyruvate isomerase family mycothiol-dependent enzyme n=1 Tax=Nocardioides coralli TaxID=2872154 RepID=UPI001CA3CC8A|nr:maleylpyruvate isomerase family mycothiol-dependent enzyme [Nocardioides coralli]QZY30654.1 maleylpyruvate isomerase family mycothiol-dependent enzyme [Nocardioides coralli]
MADPTTTALDADVLVAAGHRLTRTVDALEPDDWHAPSLLPGWTRSHVVAHLALNGEALGGVLRGVVDGETVPMYPSQQRRDDDIEELAAAERSNLRDRLLASLTTFVEAARAVPEHAWSGRFDRTTDGPSLPLDAIPLMRLRELEIHHADLGAGYTSADWSTAFAEHVISSMSRRLDPDQGFRVAPLDASRTWDVGEIGEDSRVVTGPVTDVAWWLTGREPSDQVSCSRGALPMIGGW